MQVHNATTVAQDLEASIQAGGIHITANMDCQNDGTTLMLMEDVRMFAAGEQTGGVCPICNRIQFFDLPKAGISYKPADYCPEIAEAFTN